MPEPLPFSDLLAALRDQGLPVGVREHLVVGRLLARWEETDTGPLRTALAAVLARNSEEVRLVRDTFDQLYGAAAPAPGLGSGSSPAAAPRRRLLALGRGWIAGLVAAALALAVVLGALLRQPETPAPQPQLPSQERADPAASRPPPAIPNTFPVPDRGRSLAAAAGLASGLFLWLFGLRLRREARQRARRRLADAAEALPGPHRYEISLDELAPPFSRDLLDDVASLLGRRTAIPPRSGDLDVDRTLARTLRAGLAPQIVLRARASAHPILVLEDVGDEMRPWRRRVSALLHGLEARGVPLDRWRFHADAGRVFRDPGAPPLTLKQLFRLRAESPLLVVSTGEGILEGTQGRPAPWLAALPGWRYRAWLQPVTDPAYWRPALARAPLHVWPMTPEGVLAAARQLIQGELGRPDREIARALPQRRVSPLDVERLRWLLTLAPRRDPDLAELLRQRFHPHVPQAALLEALEAPPATAPPGVGPPAAEVHAFLVGVLGASEPPAGTAAHERWRLDRALQEVRVPGREEPAARELIGLGQGPLAGEVVSAVERLTGPRSSLRRAVLRPALSRARRQEAGGDGWRWTWPDRTEIAVALVCLGLLGWALPQLSRDFRREEPVVLERVYRLEVVARTGAGTVVLRAEQSAGAQAPAVAGLYLDGQRLRSVNLYGGSVTEEVGTGHWYDLRAPAGQGRLAISEAPVWVPESTPIPSAPASRDAATTPEPAPPAPVKAAPARPSKAPPARLTKAPGASPSKAPAPSPSYAPGASLSKALAASPKQAAESASMMQRLEALGAKLTQLTAEVKKAPIDKKTAFEIQGSLRRLDQRLDQWIKSGIGAGEPDEFESELARIEKEIAGGRQQAALTLDSISPKRGARGSVLKVEIVGTNLDSNATLTFSGKGIGALEYSYDPMVLGRREWTISIAPDAEPGPRDVIVTNPGGSSKTLPAAFVVIENAPAAN